MDLWIPTTNPPASCPRSCWCRPRSRRWARTLKRRTRDTTANTKFPVANPRRARIPRRGPVLLERHAAYTGNSTKAWYLLADPAAYPLIEGGVPSTARNPRPSNVRCGLQHAPGIRMRGCHDFGVNLQDPRGGGVKNRGEVKAMPRAEAQVLRGSRRAPSELGKRHRPAI